MSSDKRRKARIQGGWAGPARGKQAGPSPRSDDHKPKIAPQPNWLGKNADPATTKKFVFEEPVEVKQKAKETVIEKAGVYDISMEPSGISRVRLFPNFIESAECDWMFEELLQGLPWKQKSDVKEGEEYLQPRLTAWFGDHDYSYSGLTHPANTKWSPLLTTLKQRLEENTGVQFNSMLANLYRNGHDHVPWHSDDEPGLRPNPVIASLTFGDLRMFELRKKPPKAMSDMGDYSGCEVVRIPLDAGTLLIMEGSTQEDWHHRVPREYHDREARINLTFRVIYPV